MRRRSAPAAEVLGYDFIVDLPGEPAARCNPVNAPVGCDLSDG